MREWIRAFAGVFFAFLGVQSEENRRHDFEKVRFSVLAVAGLILTFVFLSIVYGLVQLAMMYVQYRLRLGPREQGLLDAKKQVFWSRF